MSYHERPVESCIKYTSSGKFRVEVRVNWQVKNRRFDTLSDARRWRDEMIASRPKREERNGKPARSSEETSHRVTVRDAIASAERYEEVRDGVLYSVVSLPDAL